MSAELHCVQVAVHHCPADDHYHVVRIGDDNEVTFVGDPYDSREDATIAAGLEIERIRLELEASGVPWIRRV